MVLQQSKGGKAGQRQTGEARRRGDGGAVQQVLAPIPPTAHVAGDADDMEADARHAQQRGGAQPSPGEPPRLAGLTQRAPAEQGSCDGGHGDGQEHEGFVVGPAEMQQPHLADRAQKPGPGRRRQGAPGWQAQDGGQRPRLAVAHPLGEEAQQPRQHQGRRRSDRGGIEQVLPAESAGPLADVVDVESCPDDPGQPRRAIGRVARCMRRRTAVLRAVQAGGER